MQPSYATAGTAALVLAVGLGCTSPTDAPPGHRLLPPASIFDVTLVVDTAIAGYWLQPGDGVAVRLSLDGGARERDRPSGAVAYEGVPIWAPAPHAGGTYESTYFTHPDLGHTLVSLFWGGDLRAQRLILFIDPDAHRVSWAITVTGSAGQLVEVARGDGQ